MHTSLDSAVGRQSLLSNIGDKLLAQYGGAAAAYSLRSLNGNGDPVVRVRRETDDSEKDFTAAQIDSGEMLTWVKALDPSSSAWVSKWYDQSGNGRHAAQPSIALQPKIVDAGIYLEELKFDGTNDHLLCETVLFDTDDLLSVHLVAKLSDVTSRRQTLLSYVYSIQSNPSAANGFAIEQSVFNTLNLAGVVDPDYWTGGDPAYDQNYLLGTQILSTDYILHSLQLNNSTLSLFQDDSIVGSNSPAGMSSNRVAFWQRLRIGGDEGEFQAMNGSIKEIIIYNSDQSSNREAINDNINEYHNIY